MNFMCVIAAIVGNLLLYADGKESIKQGPSLHNIFSQDSKPSFNRTSSDDSRNVNYRIESSHDYRKYGESSCLVTLLNTAESVIGNAKKIATSQESCSDSIPCEKPMDCSEIQSGNPNSKSGIFEIWPRNRISSGSIKVYCDMEDEGGAWTVIQRRGNFDSGKQYFYQDWAAYKNGFGSLQKDFWLGNDNIFALTNQVSNMIKFTLSDWEGNKTYATYDEFWIDDEVHKYTLHVQGYRGTAGDSFTAHNGAPFSTKDRDNDSYSKNCAVQFKGAWWYTACHSSNLNGAYLKGVHESHADGVEWKLFRGHKYSLKDTVMKIRPKDLKDVLVDITPH